MKFAKLFMTTLAALALAACASSTDTEDWPVPEAPISEMDYTPTATTFTLWAPTAEEVEVRLYADNQLQETLPLSPIEACQWRTT